jgi:hypothetical protein
MIAILLAAQLSAALPQGAPLDQVPPLNSATVRGALGVGSEIIRTLPAPATCPGAGRMEASLARPMALYRQGDRPPRIYLKWVDYPDGRLCQAGAAP